MSKRAISVAGLVVVVIPALGACHAVANRVDDRPWTPGRTCTATTRSSDGYRSQIRVERDRYGRVVRFERLHREFPDESFFGVRRTYRADGTVVEQRVEANTDTASRLRVEYERDERGHVVSERSSHDHVLHGYDALGRLVETRYVGTGAVARYTWLDEHHVEVWSGASERTLRRLSAFVLDDSGRVLERSGATRSEDSSNHDQYVRDANGHLVEVVEYVGDRVVERERYALDRLGRATTSTRDFLDDGSVESTTTTTYERDYGAYPCATEALPGVFVRDRP